MQVRQIHLELLPVTIRCFLSMQTFSYSLLRLVLQLRKLHASVQEFLNSLSYLIPRTRSCGNQKEISIWQNGTGRRRFTYPSPRSGLTHRECSALLIANVRQPLYLVSRGLERDYIIIIGYNLVKAGLSCFPIGVLSCASPRSMQIDILMICTRISPGTKQSSRSELVNIHSIFL